MNARQDSMNPVQHPRLVEEKPDVYMAMGNTAEVVARTDTT